MTFSPEGLITGISSNVGQLTGCPAAAWIGLPIVRTMTDDTAFRIPLMMDTAVQQGCWKGAITFQAQDDTELNAYGVLYPLIGSSNGASGFVLLSLPGTSKQALPSHEIESSLRGLIHELNNPLTILSGFTQLLMHNPDCSKKMRADAEKLYVETCRIIEVANKLRALAVSLQGGNNPPEAPASDRSSDS